MCNKTVVAREGGVCVNEGGNDEAWARFSAGAMEEIGGVVGQEAAEKPVREMAERRGRHSVQPTRWCSMGVAISGQFQRVFSGTAVHGVQNNAFQDLSEGVCTLW